MSSHIFISKLLTRGKMRQTPSMILMHMGHHMGPSKGRTGVWNTRPKLMIATDPPVQPRCWKITTWVATSRGNPRVQHGITFLLKWSDHSEFVGLTWSTLIHLAAKKITILTTIWKMGQNPITLNSPVILHVVHPFICSHGEFWPIPHMIPATLRMPGIFSSFSSATWASWGSFACTCSFAVSGCSRCSTGVASSFSWAKFRSLKDRPMVVATHGGSALVNQRLASGKYRSKPVNRESIHG